MTSSTSPSISSQQTPLPIIATVSRVVSMVVDRLTGDRADFPLMVAAATVEALKLHGIQAQVMYGPAAWVEVLENQSVIWAGCWGQSFHFWVATQFGEVVDLNTSVAHRKRAHDRPDLKPVMSPPMLWSREVPGLYRYKPEGIAELELTEQKDIDRFALALQEIRTKCSPLAIDLTAPDTELDFPNEPILCPGRRLLDDSKESFKHFDRAILVHGIPDAPI